MSNIPSKFKDCNALAKAYEALEKEYTRKCQELKQLREKEAEGLKPIFMHAPRYARTSLVDIPDELIRKVYDQLAIKATEPRMGYLYPIEPYKPEPMDANLWLKVNPFIDITQPKVIFVKFK